MIGPEKCPPDDKRLPAILALIQNCFADMDGRIDPPSSMNHLTLEAIKQHCVRGEVWALGSPPIACIFLKEKNGRLYLGKLAVDRNHRAQGLAKKLVKLAKTRALQQGFNELELEVRIELSQNHLVFEKLGFFKVCEGAHEGYDRPTYVVMRKTL